MLGSIPDDFLARRTAGNVVEALGIVAFRASPVWVLAALADVCGTGRVLIPEISDALKAQGLLEKDAQFTSVDEMLDGWAMYSTRLAATINTPLARHRGAPARLDWHPRCRAKPAARELAVTRSDRGRVEPAQGGVRPTEPIGVRNIVNDGAVSGAFGSRRGALAFGVGVGRRDPYRSVSRRRSWIITGRR